MKIIFRAARNPHTRNDRKTYRPEIERYRTFFMLSGLHISFVMQMLELVFPVGGAVEARLSDTRETMVFRARARLN